MSTVVRPPRQGRTTHVGAGCPLPVLLRVLVRASLRESLRDRGLLALAVATPLVVAALALTVQGLVTGTAWRVQVAGEGPAATHVAAALQRDGDVVDAVHGLLAAPGPDVDATIVVTDELVLVRVTASSALAVADLRSVVADTLPGRPVQVLGPDGRPAHDLSAHLLAGAVALTAVVLAFPGTAERVACWRRRGTLGLLTGAGGLRGPAGLRLLGLALLPSRMLLTVPAVVVALVGCALTRTLDLRGTGVAVLVVTFVLGSAVCTGLGMVGGFLLRSRGEVAALSWIVVGLVVVFGGVLLPFSGVPQAAADVLRWSPSSVFADSWRDGLTGGPVGVRDLGGIALLFVGSALVAVLVQVRVVGREHRP